MYSIPRSITLFQEPSKATVHKIVEDRIRVYWDSTYWDADIYMQNFGDCSPVILPGQFVTVIGRSSNKLVALMSKYP